MTGRQRKQVSAEALRGILILYDGDVYELAQLLLRIHAARDKGTNCTSQSTINGLAKHYCNLANVKFDIVVEVLQRHGMWLGATVEPFP